MHRSCCFYNLHCKGWAGPWFLYFVRLYGTVFLLHSTILYYIVLYCIIWCYVRINSTIFCSVRLYSTWLYYIILDYARLYYTILHDTMFLPYYTVLYYVTMLYLAILFVLYYDISYYITLRYISTMQAFLREPGYSCLLAKVVLGLYNGDEELDSLCFSSMRTVWGLGLGFGV